MEAWREEPMSSWRPSGRDKSSSFDKVAKEKRRGAKGSGFRIGKMGRE